MLDTLLCIVCHMGQFALMLVNKNISASVKTESSTMQLHITVQIRPDYTPEVRKNLTRS